MKHCQPGDKIEDLEQQTTLGPATPNGMLLDNTPGAISETTHLLAPSFSSEETQNCNGYGADVSQDSASDVSTAVIPSQSKFSAWKTEAWTMISSSATMSITFLLQYSINFVSIFAAGRLGTLELGAVALANMTVAVTCLAPIIGLATALDTLCAQAYGDGRRHLVGLYCQRMALMLTIVSIPIAILWWNSLPIFQSLLDDPESARLASLYVKVMIFSLPGCIVFETGKRILQAQGLFKDTTYMLLIVAPLNVLVIWLLTFKLRLGFIGAPIGVAFSRNMLALALIIFIKVGKGSQCWGGFSKRTFTGWRPMVWLGLPGMVMILAEWGSFEIMTFLASRFGEDYLAAQSALITSSSISFQVPFAISVASSTRVANLIGAGLVERAKLATQVATSIFILMGGTICLLYVSLRSYIPLVFTNDEAVIAIAADVMPIVGAMEVFDVIGTGANGLLRGIGKQSICSPVSLFAFYAVALPLSLHLAFDADMKLVGLWIGNSTALVVITIVVGTVIVFTNWDKASEEARKRNMAN